MYIYTIYRVVNKVDGKSYIGFTQNFITRKIQHINSSFNPNSRSYDYAFHIAIRSFGKDNFDWSILYQSKDKHHTKNKMENYFITEYNTYVGFDNCNGYNMTMGGDGNPVYIKNLKSYDVISPSGNLIKIENLMNFCFENRLDSSTFRKVCVGKRKHYKGYKNINFPDWNPKDVNKDKVVVTNGIETIRIDKNDERYLSGEYYYILKNKVVAKDSTGKIHVVDKNDEKYLNNDLVGASKGINTFSKIRKYIIFDTKNNKVIITNHLKLFCENNEISYGNANQNISTSQKYLVKKQFKFFKHTDEVLKNIVSNCSVLPIIEEQMFDKQN